MTRYNPAQPVSAATQGIYDRIKDALDATEAQVHFESILGLFTFSAPTVKKHLRGFLARNQEYVDRIEGFLPDADVLIDRVEREIGQLTAASLWDGNLACKSLVDRVIRPMHARYLRQNVGAGTDGRPQLTTEALIDFLYEDYTQFVRDTNNGVTSTAGRINERLVARALVNAGLAEDTHFITTGTNSDADLVVLQTAGNRRRLSVEIKSYNARERLLRGLRDAPEPKVAVGFFRNAGEFGPVRTLTLLGASPLAIYMPMDTYTDLDPASRTPRTLRQDSLYRPLDEFVNDMRHFTVHGELPPYP
ncbi:hypothetical protein [Burkholderia stagnalis]|uniref:hypothetical protein n=1 Tax=Burkholderia stagnalis TaxID=1503054 RepID=UPI000F5C1051|nr:hypothetical protein [Burkholderia stagnalis]RQP98059.1 hypothetical protein DF164_31675 [Burkholderia stagnalis]RQY68854.1 hypothetical protein DF110_18635 [Burkholderia stagnalis]